MRSLCAVGFSAVALAVVHGVVGHFLKGGAIVSLIPYLAGVIAAVLVMKLLMARFPKERGEDETAPSYPKLAGKGKTVLAASVSLAVLLGMNIGLYFVSGGGVARSGQELIVSAVIGVLVKPPLEELLFRYGYMKAMVGKGEMYLPVAIGFQAALFALWHKPESMVFAFFAGVVLAEAASVCYDGTEAGYKRGFACAVTVHALHNLILYVVEAVVGVIK